MLDQLSGVNRVLSISTNPVTSDIRFCLSDSIAGCISEVITGELSPVEFARITTKRNWQKYFNYFSNKYPFPASLDEESLKQMWVFDNLLKAAVAYRMLSIRANHTEDESYRFMRSGYPYQLFIQTDSGDISSFAGLSYPKSIVGNFVRHFDGAAHHRSRGTLLRLADALGDISDDTYFLNDPHWKKCLIYNPTKLQEFRAFIAVATNSYVISDLNLKPIFNITRDRLMDDVRWFLELRETSDVDVSEIQEFLRVISHYAYGIDPHQFLETLYHKGYPTFVQTYRQVHREATGELTKDLSREISSMKEWVHLNAVSGEYAFANVMESELNPVALSEKITKAHFGQIHSGLIPYILSLRGEVMPAYPEGDKSWTEALCVDALTTMLVAGRVVYRGIIPLEEIESHLMDRAHILFSFVDNERELLGMSLTSILIRYRLGKDTSKFTEQEHEALYLFASLWTKLALFRTTATDPHVHSVFSNLLIRERFRIFLFGLFEVLNLSTDDVKMEEILSFNRPQFFTYLEELNSILCQTLDSDVLSNHLARCFKILDSCILGESDRYLWGLNLNVPINRVPDDESEEIVDDTETKSIY